MGAAFGWGAVAASSLVLGMFLGLLRPWPSRLIGLVLAFGAGALVSAVSFELFEEGVQVGGAAAVGIGVGVGAVVYFVLARAVENLGPGGGSGGTALALGAFLDGIPEQMVLGIGMAGGDGVGGGHIAPTRRGGGGARLSALSFFWFGVAALCALATPLGYALAAGTGGH